jgi:hypothetical protein
MQQAARHGYPTAACRLRSPILRFPLSLRRTLSAADAAAAFGRIPAQRIGEGTCLRRARGGFSAAIHVGDEGNIAAASYHRCAIDGIFRNAEAFALRVPKTLSAFMR